MASAKSIFVKSLRYIIPLVITVGLCIVLYSDVEWGEIERGLQTCSYPLVCSFLCCNVLAMMCRALRWRIQLRAIDVNPGFGQMCRSIFGTYAVNLVFPRLGELWRCQYISSRNKAPFSGVFGSMVADRLADTLAVALLALLALLVTSSAMLTFMAESNLVEKFTSPYVIVGGVGLVLAVIAVCLVSKRVRRFAIGTFQGFASIFRMKGVGRWLLLTLAIWTCYFISMWLSMEAFPGTAALIHADGLTPVLVAFVFGSLSMGIPSNGGIGPWQLAIILALSGIYGLPRGEALAFATLNLAFTTLLTIGLGLYTFIYIARHKS